MNEDLVWVGLIRKLEPIPGADRIQLAEVVCGRGGKWLGIVKRGEFQEGGTCQVYLQDSVLPQLPEFEFMAARKYIVRMVRLRGVPSECLIMPQTILGSMGDDITALAGVTKYEKQLPANMAGETLGHFPSFIPKTDEPNFQAVPYLVDALRGLPYYVTEKADGTSTTVYRRGDHFGVCSRNWEKKESDQLVFWRIVKEYGIDKWLPDGVALQWETVGPGIQSNRMGLKKPEPRLFNVYDIAERRYGDLGVLKALGQKLPLVKILEEGNSFDSGITNEELRKFAEGEYSNGGQREGVVFRPIKEKRIACVADFVQVGDVLQPTIRQAREDESPMEAVRLSFKVLNLKYKG